jgi:proteasome activator subunit 4
VIEFIDQNTVYEAGILLKDPKDPRHQYVANLRERSGLMLHQAASRLKDYGAEDAIDSVKMIM